MARLHQKLKRLPQVAKQHIRGEMEKVADNIVAMMKALVAVDDGELRDSIGWTWGKAPKGSMVISRVKASLGGELTLTIYAGNSEVYWARWIEYGTASHPNKGKFTGTKNPGTSAQPFFYVSWRANKKSAVRAIRKASRDAAKKVAARS
ncbi:HK97 gp10 family phage protein [Rhizobium sp. Root483D2]|uniref:HK97 gp10 family phage protein n=1 Tax=Rhizobium sp. Root483D2 TaxID=1736545 RepID=UPI001FCD7CA2|nr:HK97 gp10 family phage protein [Rhizobium sp. Root483D2]